MDMQKFLKPLLLISGCLLATQASAASIGTYTFADNAIADQISGTGQAYNGTDWYSASGNTWQVYDSTSASWVASATPGDATDTSGSTFLAATQSSSPLSLNLGFSQTSAVNGAGSDIAFFFLFDQSTNIADITINGITQSLTFSNVFDNNGTQQVANNVAWNGATLSNVQLMAGVINLDDFGFALGDTLNESITLDLTSTGNNAMALSMAAALNSSPVPLPAPLLLLLSGLAGLGLIARRK
ncbi:hypothetical protein MNBD_GAMMA09-1795 [hydrothermal vent metagenome]|uniref:PEP-CTERM protein-sorting domain-containing protein n=1 Tax=hydrothermal vent metagenome TaxID=652676 RepID=A0A3B0XYH8_9ZZZZ